MRIIFYIVSFLWTALLLLHVNAFNAFKLPLHVFGYTLCFSLHEIWTDWQYLFLYYLPIATLGACEYLPSALEIKCKGRYKLAGRDVSLQPLKNYISTTTITVAFELGNVVTYHKSFYRKIKLSFITWSCGIAWQTKSFIFPNPQCQGSPNLVGWSLTLRSSYP